jgi:hypothetical protein
MFLATLVFLTCQGRAQESDYIVADAVGKSDAFYPVAEKLAAHRRGKIVSLDIENLNAFRDVLRQKPPQYVAIVLRPEQLDYDFARKLLVMATQIDDDPFVDFSYGFVTAATAEEALAFVARSIESEQTNREPNLGSIGVWEIARSTEVLGTFPSRNTGIAHLEGRLASPQQLQKEARDTQFIQMFLPKLQGKSVVVFGGHGYPREVVGGPTWKDLAGLKLDSAVALNIACYTGVTETWFENDRNDRVVRRRKIPMSESFALALLRTGVIGYVAYGCERPAGPELFTDLSALVFEGLSLGDVRRRDYDKIVLGYLGDGANKMELKPITDGQKIEPPKDIAQDFMLESGTGGILFGDPALVPFKGKSNDAPVAVTMRQDEVTETLIVDAEIQPEHLFTFCSEPTASWDGRGAEAMKVYTKVPVPEGYVSGVKVRQLNIGSASLKSRLVWAIDPFEGALSPTSSDRHAELSPAGRRPKCCYKRRRAGEFPDTTHRRSRQSGVPTRRSAAGNGASAGSRRQRCPACARRLATLAIGATGSSHSEVPASRCTRSQKPGGLERTRLGQFQHRQDARSREGVPQGPIAQFQSSSCSERPWPNLPRAEKIRPGGDPLSQGGSAGVSRLVRVGEALSDPGKIRAG